MDFPANPKEKAGYHLEFCDEFLGKDLDRTKSSGRIKVRPGFVKWIIFGVIGPLRVMI
jgi:hypothetical protein